VNHAPTITSASATPFGVSALTPLTFSASATDEDNDVVTYKWSFAGQTSTSQSFTTTLSGDGIVVIMLTVTDARGAQTSTTVSTTLGILTGQWNLFLGSGSSCGPFGISRPPVMTLIQSGQTITGALASPGGWCNVPGGTPGSLDPGAPGSVDAAGNVSMRLKIGQFLDTFLSGHFSISGREITGTTTFQDSGNRSTFTMRKL
jgi:PKD domain